MSDKMSQEAEDEKEEEETVVKTKDPLSGNICVETINPVHTLWIYNDPEHLDITLLLSFSKTFSLCKSEESKHSDPESLGSNATTLCNQEMTALPLFSYR